ncbi:hypothetical protein [Roseiarcus sp.]|uniref:hypothetical protein n=1 Tax=Roseiarcus sp. TaxID=1969460 RepID=UPI003D0FA801
MRALGRIATRLAAAVLAAAPVSARADGCSVDDLWNAIESTASAITSDACAAACADTAGAGCTAAAGITAGLGVAAASQGQGAVDGFCSQVNNAQTAVGDVGALQSWANAAGMSLDLVSALGSIGDPLSIVQCSCSLEQGVNQLGGDTLSCFQDAICGLQQDLGWGGCGCHPPPPVAANCTPPPDCVINNTDPGCENAIYGAQSNPPGQIVKSLSNGTMVVDVTDGWDGKSYWCSPDRYCFCPSPMKLAAVPNDYMNGGTPSNGYVIYYCQCPNLGPGQTTHAAAASGPLAEVCICDSTGLAAVPPVKSIVNPTASICPIPLTGIPCPSGEVRVGSKCVAPCTSKSQVMTPYGACCDPTQVTSCGTCCPAGTVPDAWHVRSKRDDAIGHRWLVGATILSGRAARSGVESLCGSRRP